MIMEPSGSHYGSYFVVDRVLLDKKSEYQRILIFESQQLGRVLMLDNIFNVSTRMEAYYHEPMAHLPLAMLDDPKRVLLIGGGDFGIAKELLKHKGLEEVVMCELDGEVLDACRTYFPEWASCESDPRFHLKVGDGFAYLKERGEKSFDAIIVDSTDPILHAPMLISKSFYREAERVLKDEGVCMQIIADHILYPEAWETVIQRMQGEFADIHPLFLPIPFYATGAWGLCVSAKNKGTIQPARCDEAFLSGIEGLRTMTAPRVQGWFSLTPELQAFFKDLK